MKNLFFRSLVSVLVLTLSSSSIVFAQATPNEFGGCEVRAEGFTPGTTVTYTNNGTVVNCPNRIGDAGVAACTIGKKNVDPGANNIVIRGSNGITKAFTCFIKTTGGGNTGGGNTGGGNTGGGTTNPPPPPPPPPPPVPAKKELDLEKVENQAKNNARFAANQIRDNFARAERRRFNFAKGLRHGLRFANRWTEVENYAAGLTIGSALGKSRGRSDAVTPGTNAGETAGRNEAVRRFEAVVDTGVAPSRENIAVEAAAPVPQIPFFESLSLNAQLEAAENRYDDLFSNVRHSTIYFDFNIFNGEWSLLVIRDRYTSAPRSYPEAGTAFGIYLRSRNDEMVTWWNRFLENDEEFSNTVEGKRVFQSAFMREYNRVIDDKWFEEVEKEDRAAFNLGVEVGEQAVNDVAFAEGKRDGFIDGYRNGFFSTYFASFNIGLTNGFDAIWNHYSNNAVLEGLRFNVSSAFGTNLFVPGTPLNIDITGLKNVGQQPADVQFSLVAGTANPLGVRTLPMKASSTLKETVKLDLLGEVSSAVPADGPFNIIVNASGVQSSQQLTSSWWMTVKSLGLAAQKTDADSKKIFEATKKHILAKLTEEWVRDGLKPGHRFGQERNEFKMTLIRKLVEIFDNEGAAQPGIQKIGWEIIMKVYDNRQFPAFGSPNHASITQFLKLRLRLK